MPRGNFNTQWGEDAPQFEKPDDSKIAEGWKGGADEEPPEAKWENWWHNRVDSALQQIERYGAMDYDAEAVYGIGAVARANGSFYISVASDNVGNNPVTNSGAQWIIDNGPGNNVRVFESSTTWSVPLVLRLGLRAAQVHAIGGGGGGAKDNENGAGGGGGAGGESFARVNLKGVSSVSVTVGQGGNGGSISAGQTSGFNGSSSSFGSYATAGGGRGGLTASGSRGGTASGGYLNRNGAPGGPGLRLSDGKFSGAGGGMGGGPAIYGNQDANTSGNPGTSPGAGGSGSVGTSVGGSGADGVVVVTW